MSEQKLIRFPQESVIIREGEMNREMYKIIGGHAEMYTGYGTNLVNFLGLLGKQSFFGEFGLLLGKPSIYTVIAYSDLTVLKITEEDLSSFIVENHKNVVDIMRNMAGCMFTMKMQIDLLLKELEKPGKTDDEVLKERIREAKRVMRDYAVSSYAANAGEFDSKA